jgi:hypothetical protein
MDHLDSRKRIASAQKLLLETTTSLEKFTAIRTILAGYNPKIDELLARADHELATLSKIYDGKLIELGLEHLPEETEEEKKRKRALVAFLATWKDLSGEVSRVATELDTINSSNDVSAQARSGGKILTDAKGAFGIVTIVAVGIVVALQVTSVTVDIKNVGCGTLEGTGTAVSLPGLSVPSGPIKEGAVVRATLPPLTLTIDGTTPGSVVLSAISFSLSIDLPSNIVAAELDGVSLLSNKTVLALATQKNHTLALICK